MGWVIAIVLLVIIVPGFAKLIGGLFGFVLALAALWMGVALMLMESGMSGLAAAALGLLITIWAASWLVEWAKAKWP